MLGVMDRVEDVIAQYDADPANLTERRARISRHILETYSREAAIDAFRKAWADVETWAETPRSDG